MQKKILLALVPPSVSHERASEAGYMLIAVLVLVAFVLIALAVAAPAVATELQRDKEYELYHRGLQYSRAIRLYYKRFGKYPNTIEQLEKTNQVRFLRRRYVDPMTGKDAWRLIHVGESKIGAANLFGVPSNGANNTSSSSSNSGGNPAVPPGRLGSYGPGSSGSGGLGSFGGSGSFGGQSGIGQSSSDATDGSSGSQSGAGGSGTSGSNGSSGSSGTGTTGQTFGGGGIVGVSSTSPKPSIREYRKQTHYNQWEFVYDASQEVMGATGIGLPQSGATNPNNSSGSTPIATPTGPSQTPPQQITPQ